MNNYFVVLLLGHIIGDYYFQSETIAINKDKKYKSLLLHCLLYSGVMIFLSLVFQNMNAFIGAILVSFIHFVIDSSKYKLYQIQHSYKGKGYVTLIKWINNGKLYILDQALHILSIVLINLFFLQQTNSYDGLLFIGLHELDENLVLKILLVTLILMKPVNITFKKTFNMIKPIMEEDGHFDSERNVGKIIGNLERLLIFVLLLLNQYGAIGLVFTAKSITRYNKIVENKKFGEYYLLGTLYSLLSTLVLYLIFIKIKY